jgi:hypothetical protein
MDNGIRFPNNYDRIVLLFYLPGAGGKFLNTCLGLSDQYIFQDFNLAIKQVNGKFNLHEKLNYINEKLLKAEKFNIWNDMDLGCVQLYGMFANEWSISNYGNSLNFISNKIEQLVSSKMWLSKICHDIGKLKNWLELFPNAKIINFYNFTRFINKRSLFYNYIRVWEDLKKSNWPKNPPLTIKEFYNLPTNLILEIDEVFTGIKDKLLFDNEYELHCNNFITTLKQNNSNIYDWDVEWYNDSDKFLRELKLLYEKLELTINWKDEQVLNYRQRWLDAIF